MNIAIDIRSLMKKERTGVGEYTYELLDALFKDTDFIDNKNQYFLFYNSYKDVSENIPKWNYDNVYYVYTRWPNKVLNLLVWLRFIRIDTLMKRKIKNKELKLDWFFAPNINFLSLSKKIKLILTIHDLSFELLPECFPFKWRLVYKILRFKKKCKRADIILTPSENTKRDVEREYGMEKDKMKVLRPGLCSDIANQIECNTNTEIEDIKKKYNLSKKYILYLGTIEPRKNILGIIEAYKKSSLFSDDYLLVIAGASGWKNKNIFKSIENTAGVKYIGYVDDKDKAMLYNEASLFVYPSLYEGFGLPVLEALACGTSVITSNRSSLSEVFGDYVTLVNPYNITEIEKAMKDILLDRVELSKIDLKKFSWSISVKIFLKNLQ